MHPPNLISLAPILAILGAVGKLDIDPLSGYIFGRNVVLAKTSLGESFHRLVQVNAHESPSVTCFYLAIVVPCGRLY